MAKFPALPLWTDALIGDTFHLTPAQFGAYLRLLIVEWRDPDCSLPNDDIFLGRSIGDPKNWHRLKPIVLPYFTLGEDGRYRQKRLLDERDSCARYAARSSAGGDAKALKRKHRDAAKHVPNVCLEAAPYSSPLSNPKKEETTTTASVAVVGFDDFFKEMPRQWNKTEAKRAYSEALTKATPEVILSAAKKYAVKASSFEDQFILPPAKWLKDERWVDFAGLGKVSAFHSPEELENQRRFKEKYNNGNA